MRLSEYYSRMAYWDYADPERQITQNVIDGLYCGWGTDILFNLGGFKNGKRKSVPQYQRLSDLRP